MRLAYTPPQAKLAARVDARVPGSLQELQHPLRAILKQQPSRTTMSEAFLQRLKPDVQAVLLEPVGGIEVYWHRARVTVVLMRKLERIARLCTKSPEPDLKDLKDDQ